MNSKNTRQHWKVRQSVNQCPKKGYRRRAQELGLRSTSVRRTLPECHQDVSCWTNTFCRHQFTMVPARWCNSTYREYVHGTAATTFRWQSHLKKTPVSLGPTFTRSKSFRFILVGLHKRQCVGLCGTPKHYLPAQEKNWRIYPWNSNGNVCKSDTEFWVSFESLFGPCRWPCWKCCS